MRRYAYLKEPVKTNKKDYIYKIMLYQTKKDGVCLFMYCQKDAVQCSFDYWYKTLEDVYEDWNELIDENGWIDFDDPLPDCQHDAFLPIRVKGRDIGEPQWGKLEILENGKWKDYTPDQQSLEVPGYKKLKVVDIAASVGIGTGTFYNFFKSKDEFIIWLIMRRKDESLQQFSELSKKHPKGIPMKAQVLPIWIN